MQSEPNAPPSTPRPNVRPVATNVSRIPPKNAFTEEEIRKKFLDMVRSTVEYWATLPEKTVEGRLNGLAFSLLAMLDGCSAGFPGCKVIPIPHHSDKNYCLTRGEKYIPRNIDIAGHLHEQYYETKPCEPNSDSKGQ